MGAMWSLAVITVGALPLVGVVSPAGPARGGASAIGSAPWQAVQDAIEDRSYLLLHAGSYVRIPHCVSRDAPAGRSESLRFAAAVASWSLALIGLANIVGSLIAGWCTQRFRSKYILAMMYGSRALLIGWYLLEPRTKWTFYSFAVGLGLTWLATVPPTATIVGKLFGIRYLSTLFGLTLLSHQIGGFLGAYLGGLALFDSVIISGCGTQIWPWRLPPRSSICRSRARIAPVSSPA